MQQGYIKARVYTSDAMIPIEGASFSVYKEEDAMKLLGHTVSDINGITPTITIDAPDKSLSQSSGDNAPYTSVRVKIYHVNYKTLEVDGVQIFAGETSIQDAPLIPIGANTADDDKSESFFVDRQNL